MIVGPRYNDVDPAVEAAYGREAEAEFECGYPEGCCDHAGSDESGNCWDCLNTGHTHETGVGL